MNNRTTLAQLREMSESNAAALPTDHLALLLEDVAEAKRDATALDAKLSAALHIRFGERAAMQRKAKGKDSGTVSLADGDFKVVCDLPQRVEWDQAKMDAACATILQWGEKPSEYVKSALSVPESKWKAWPKAIRDVFAPARTVGHGKPSYKIERMEATK